MTQQSGAKVAAALIAFAFLFRAWDFGNPVLHVDEEWYLLVGDRMRAGELPYLDLWDRKPLGLFAIYAAIRWLPGDGVVAYQVVACLFAGATAWAVERAAREVGASAGAALAAGAAYLIWLPLLSGWGGQSPVFYNLPVAGAALLTLRLPRRTGARAVWWSGAAACALAGLAIQTKYTPAVEGALFGCAHVYHLRRAGARWPLTVAAALAWIALGALPTLVAAWSYWRLGAVAWRAWWFANVVSITLRHGYPPAKIAMRLLGTGAQLAPLVVGAALAPMSRWKKRARSDRRAVVEKENSQRSVSPPPPSRYARHLPLAGEKLNPVLLRTLSPPVLARRARGGGVALAWGWLAAALVAWASVGAFFDHYALPLLPPLCVLAALGWTERGRVMGVSLGLALATVVVKAALRPDDAPGARAVAAFVAAHDGRECPFVFTGDSATYLLAHACTPTAYAFPSTLSYASEQGSTGIDEAAEVRRVMARRPPAVVTLAEPLAPLNLASLRVMRAALARDYRPAFSAPGHYSRVIVWLRTARSAPKRTR